MIPWQFVNITAGTGAPSLLSVGWPPVAYSLGVQGSQHVYYLAGQLVKVQGAVVDIDASVHELWRGSHGWHHTDLTAALGLPLVTPAAGYAFDFYGTRHLVCFDMNSHIHELRGDPGGWYHSDLTVDTGAPVGVPMTGYAFEAQRTGHVIYIDDAPTRHIHELWWDTNGWHHNDLTAATGAPTGNAVGYAFEGSYTQHIFYSSSTDNHIHELWWDAGGWQHSDLTAATGAPVSTWPFVRAYPFDAKATQHVLFVAGHQLHELRWDTNGWRHDDLTALANAPDAAANGTPVGYAANAHGIRYVVYRGAGNDDHIHQLWRDNTRWQHRDLTTATGAPSGMWPSAGYVSETADTQHIICTRTASFEEQQEHIYELRGPAQSMSPMWLPKPDLTPFPPFPKKLPPRLS
ncbi:hypothetical protein JDV09_18360 [Mycobacterium sp. Y57]|uniref:hypothetical protein n=1 Tax=Mycolicibacterium xanthum TaxID=2796469 RepID=UPI001C846CA1|nr:hypothetical protein [Mycolicibacterium xanthum]MBX7434061.1 hypothetical protein [Mycolicibacterium xanthum]